MIRTTDYLDEIRALLLKYGLPADTVLIVPDVRDWCRKHGLTEANPFRIAVTVRRGDGKHLIVLVEEITDQMLPGVYSLLDIRLPDTAVEALRDERAFVQHLVLHEIAHALNEARSCPACDEWAAQQMPDRSEWAP